MKKQCDSRTVYNEKYLKTEIFYGKINSNFTIME